ncbi:hypothetical protein L1887_20149 [Cichorium endivia]|nr:hypothetical protein L1887_20149 [Cichorium endivia]
MLFISHSSSNAAALQCLDHAASTLVLLNPYTRSRWLVGRAINQLPYSNRNGFATHLAIPPMAEMDGGTSQWAACNTTLVSDLLNEIDLQMSRFIFSLWQVEDSIAFSRPSPATSTSIFTTVSI